MSPMQLRQRETKCSITGPWVHILAPLEIDGRAGFKCRLSDSSCQALDVAARDDASLEIQHDTNVPLCVAKGRDTLVPST